MADGGMGERGMTRHTDENKQNGSMRERDIGRETELKVRTVLKLGLCPETIYIRVYSLTAPALFYII